MCKAVINGTHCVSYRQNPTKDIYTRRPDICRIKKKIENLTVKSNEEMTSKNQS